MTEKDMGIGDLISLGQNVKGGKENISSGDCFQRAEQNVQKSYTVV
jgi:hypothetical protein